MKIILQVYTDQNFTNSFKSYSNPTLSFHFCVQLARLGSPYLTLRIPLCLIIGLHMLFAVYHSSSTLSLAISASLTFSTFLKPLFICRNSAAFKSFKRIRTFLCKFYSTSCSFLLHWQIKKCPSFPTFPLSTSFFLSEEIIHPTVWSLSDKRTI